MSKEIEMTQIADDDTVEIDLVELFYFLRHKIAWLILAVILGGIIAGGICII